LRYGDATQAGSLDVDATVIEAEKRDTLTLPGSERRGSA
jgi:hypothetical protein